MHGIQEKLKVAACAGMIHADGSTPLLLSPEQSGFREKHDPSLAVMPGRRLHQAPCRDGWRRCRQPAEGPGLVGGNVRAKHQQGAHRSPGPERRPHEGHDTIHALGRITPPGNRVIDQCAVA